MGRVASLLGLLALSGALHGASPVEVRPGEVRAGDLVAMARPVDLAGDLGGTAVLIGADARIGGRIRGSLILLGGRASLEPAARIDGDLLNVGATLATVPGLRPGDLVGGRVLTLSALEGAFLAELETSPLAARSVSPLLLAFRLLLLAAWLVLGLALLLLVHRRLAAASARVPEEAPLLGLIGTSATLTALLLSAFLVAVLPAGVALPAVALLVAGLAAAKVFGLVALFLVVGRLLNRRALRGSAWHGDPAALSLGLLLLGALSLVPVAGPVIWALASLVGIGVALRAAFEVLAPGTSPRSSPEIA